MKRYFLCTLALLACGEGEKEKVAHEGELESSYASAEVAGSWTPTADRPESAHPYANNLRQTFTIRGSADATHLRLVFDRFELENGYDYLYVYDESGRQQTRHTGTKTGQQVVIEGKVAKLTFTTDGSVTKWGYRISVSERRACVCAEIYQPVCGADGRTYGNACEAGCAGVAVRAQGECRSDWISVARNIESAHPYTNNYDETFTLREGGATQVRAHFVSIDVERGYDFIRIEDGAGRVVHEYTGQHRDVTTPAVAGDTLRIRLVTDYSVTAHGFVVDRYEVQGGCSSNAECGAGRVCNQVVCIRAPCFAVCEPAGGVNEVAVADLERNAATYHGRTVRVTAEPKSRPAYCTRIGCPMENPCCNRCGSSFIIGDGVALEGPAGTTWGCSGNECDYRSNCTPFGYEENGPYTLEGTFEHDAASGANKLSVTSFRAADCAHRGCSSQVCANAPRFTICDVRPEYACYAAATCAPQSDGHCGFTDSPTLRMCLANAQGGGRPITLPASDTPIAIPDANPAGITSAIEARGVGTAGIVKLSLTIRHTYRGDLRVALIAPSGREVVVHDRAGGSADDVIIADRTIGELSAEAGTGTWRLSVSDHDRADVGRLESWSLRFE